VNEYLLEERSPTTFGRIAALADCNVLLFGHTHKPWVREYGGVLFVNCGSVGKPKDGDPRASFAVLEPGNALAQVGIERVAYNAEAVAAEMRRVGLPDELADQLPLAA
jgi:predicted phosphodiesterase